MLAGSLGETRILDIVVVLPVFGHRKGAWEGPALRVQLMEKIATRKKKGKNSDLAEFSSLVQFSLVETPLRNSKVG